MDWIFSHLQIFIAVAGAVAYFLKQQKDATTREPEEESDASKGSMTEDTERTRRIQEEIRRKIAERRGGAQPPLVATATSARPLASPVLAPRPVANSGGGVLREKLETKLAQAQAREQARVAAQDRKEQLEGQLRENETVRLAEQRRFAEISIANRAENKATAVAQTTADALAARGSRAWLDDLRNPDSARRAMVLREVLGAPVGLR